MIAKGALRYAGTRNYARSCSLGIELSVLNAHV